MRRLTVYVFYEANGIVDTYVKDILNEIIEASEKVVFIINGHITAEALDEIGKAVSSIIIRENCGYDAGAYKDFFLTYMSKEELESYDEVVLMNNSFYGPIFKISDIFERMDCVEADFWGLTRHLRGNVGKRDEFPQHIQAYFLVIRKDMFGSKWFHEFWEDMKYPLTYSEAVNNFEIFFTTFFEAHDFIGKTLMDISEVGIELREEENPYLFYSYELLKNMQMPFIKKKCLHIENPGYINAIKSMRFIESSTDYTVDIIWNNVFRECKSNTYGSALNYYELELFYKTHEKIYIYGAGQYGRALESYFAYRGWTIESFVVTNRDAICGDDVISFSELKMSMDDGIILALSTKYAEDVFNQISQSLESEQIFTLNNFKCRKNDGKE